MKISFCHHLSLSYFGGGEKWLINLSKELSKRGHDVSIHSLPLLLDGKPKINPKLLLDDIPYSESYHHKISADIVYITYNPLNWTFFQTSRPRIAGLHTHAYWLKPNLRYGSLPNISNIVNRFTSYFELRRFDAIHTVSDVYPINHPSVFFIPNFVDSSLFKPIPKLSDFTVLFNSRKVWQKGYPTFKHVQNRLSNNGISFRETSGNIPEEELPSFIGESHVSFLPSLVDTFGLSIVESMMCGTPVLTTPLETHKTLHLPLIYGRTPTDFIANIYMLESQWKAGIYEKLSTLCREFSLQYDKNLIIDRLESMFKTVLNNYGEQ